MTATRDTVIGLDIGTTTAKALIRPRGRDEARVVERPTTWRTTSAPGTEIDPQVLLDTAVELIGAAVAAAESAWGAVAVRAVSVTGLAESGVLLDAAGRPGPPAIAWFDRRGQREMHEVAARSPLVVAAFPAVTGLPWSFQATLAKLLWLAGQHRIPRGASWLSVPEWIVHGLGGAPVREPSLASRTGLIRQDTGALWDDALALADLPARFLPDALPAGTPAGHLAHDDVPSAAAGALLSVAGHDHPVAALAVGAVGADELFNSSGTADVMARAVAAPLTDTQRAAVVAAHWSAGRHVVPGRDLLLAGGGGGLLLRRVLSALGATAPQDRDRLDAASGRITGLPPGLAVRGDGRTDQDVEIRVQDDASPAAVWLAATRHTAGLARRMLADIEPIVGPHRRAVAAGGWIRMASVRTAKADAVHGLEFSDVRQPGALGAALLAEHSLTADSRSLPEFLQSAPHPAGA